MLRYRLLAAAAACSLLLSLTAPAAWAAEERLNRNGYVSVTLTPLLYESNLQDNAFREPLEQLFRGRSEQFAEGLAEGLEKTAFYGNLRVLPGYQPEEQNELRAAIEPDHFLVAVDLRANYGLSNGSTLATCLSMASCFLLSPVEMFSYDSRIEATVTAFYITPEGKRLRLVQDRQVAQGKVGGDFFDAMDLARELEWITLLTDDGLNNLSRKILAALPPELVWRAWSKAGDALRQPPAQSAQGRALPPEPAPKKAVAAPATSTAPAERPAAPRLELQGLVRKVSPSVFKVRTDAAVGSGFVLSRRGFGLTSLHVVEGAETVTVRFHGGDELPARVVLSEPGLDLAILSFSADGLTPLPLGDSDRLTVGDSLIAIGYPLDLGLSVMPGTVSSLESYRGTPLIRIDTALAPGNSGGPLVNERGEGVGVNFRKSVGGKDETTFGIPINAARRLFAHLLDQP